VAMLSSYSFSSIEKLVEDVRIGWVFCNLSSYYSKTAYPLRIPNGYPGKKYLKVRALSLIKLCPEPLLKKKIMSHCLHCLSSEDTITLLRTRGSWIFGHCGLMVDIIFETSLLFN